MLTVFLASSLNLDTHCVPFSIQALLHSDRDTSAFGSWLLSFVAARDVLKVVPGCVLVGHLALELQQLHDQALVGVGVGEHFLVVWDLPQLANVGDVVGDDSRQSSAKQRAKLRRAHFCCGVLLPPKGEEDVERQTSVPCFSSPLLSWLGKGCYVARWQNLKLLLRQREPERQEQPEDNMPPKFKRHLNDDEVTGSVRSERRNLLEEDSDEEEDFFLRGPTGPRFGPQNDKMKHVQSQVDEVIDVMQENISKVIERGERLDDLQDKSGESQRHTFCHIPLLVFAQSLSDHASAFSSRAKQLHRRMWWRDTKMKMIIALVVVALLLIIIMTDEDEVDRSSSSPPPPLADLHHLIWHSPGRCPNHLQSSPLHPQFRSYSHVLIRDQFCSM
ncbi:hypothetical protein CCH79_00007384, partial [Gambusia affinis]